MSRPVTLSIGEVLWDVLPDGKELGGSPSNVAWECSQLGAESHIVSAVGDDPLGREILDTLRGKELDVSTIAVLPDFPTSTVDAVLDAAGNAAYTIHENVAWDRLPVNTLILDLAARARAVNYGSLGQRHPVSRAATHAILEAANPQAVKIYDINLRPPFIDRDILDAGMKRATVIKMNHDELDVVAKLFGWPAAPEETMAGLVRAYPNIGHVVVTRADQGAWWRTREALHFKAAPRLLKGWKEPDILEAAMNIASYVCSRRGGMPVLPAELKDRFLRAC